jgi:hypothetical protein
MIKNSNWQSSIRYVKAKQFQLLKHFRFPCLHPIRRREVISLPSCVLKLLYLKLSKYCSVVLHLFHNLDFLRQPLMVQVALLKLIE